MTVVVYDFFVQNVGEHPNKYSISHVALFNIPDNARPDWVATSFECLLVAHNFTGGWRNGLVEALFDSNRFSLVLSRDHFHVERSVLGPILHRVVDFNAAHSVWWDAVNGTSTLNFWAPWPSVRKHLARDRSRCMFDSVSRLVPTMRFDTTTLLQQTVLSLCDDAASYLRLCRVLKTRERSVARRMHVTSEALAALNEAKGLSAEDVTRATDEIVTAFKDYVASLLRKVPLPKGMEPDGPPVDLYNVIETAHAAHANNLRRRISL